jgi:PAS domain S-box-containing protein
MVIPIRVAKGEAMTIDFGTLILNETPDAVVLTTTEGTVVCWTNGAHAVFGYSSAEALGRRLDELIVPPKLRDGAAAVLQQTLADGVASYESMRCAKDGTLVYIDSSSKLVAPTRTIPMSFCGAKRRHRAQVLRDAKLVEARYDGILESMPDAILVANAAGRVVLANRQAEACSAMRTAPCAAWCSSI